MTSGRPPQNTRIKELMVKKNTKLACEVMRSVESYILSPIAEEVWKTTAEQMSRGTRTAPSFTSQVAQRDMNNPKKTRRSHCRGYEQPKLQFFPSQALPIRGSYWVRSKRWAVTTCADPGFLRGIGSFETHNAL